MEISLLDMCGVGIIIPCDTGIRYTNQVAGVLCLHPVQEGAFMPVYDESIRIRLSKIFERQGLSLDGITPDVANEIDLILPHFVVNKEKLKASMESWVYVFNIAQDIKPKEVILTWENSD